MDDKIEKGRKHDYLGVKKFSRRQFLGRMGIVVGGAAVASIALGSACKNPSATTAPEATTATKSSTTGATPSTTTTTPVSSTITNPPPDSTITTATTSAPPVSAYNYDPPLDLPPLLSVPNTDCTVANDGRVYSVDHVWVKSLSAGIAVLGMTTTFVEMVAYPYHIDLSALGAILKRDDTLGDIEGYKLSTDIITPVSGTVIQVNDFLLNFNKSTELEPLVTSAYNGGWLLVIQMSKLDELKSLMSATAYRDLLIKSK